MSDTRPTVAVLGTGIMGAGMTRSLLREGLEVTVWNRSTDKARPLADDGAHVAESAADAVAPADVVITMLFDTDVVAQTMEPVLPRFRDGAVWVQTSTVGIEGTDRLGVLARDAGVDYLDAPMLGTKAPAENGQLVVLASGPSSLQEKVQPVFDAIGTRTQWVSETIGDASRLKLAINAWIGVMVNGIAQSIALARGLATVIDRLRSGLPAGLEELATLGRTLHRRRDDVLAYFTHRASNGPTEAINGRLEALRRNALGFRNLICECRCGAPARRTTRLGAGDLDVAQT